MATWPASLPQSPLINGFTRTPQQGTAVYRPDIGPPIIRRRTTASGYEVTVDLLMDRTQLATFKTFFHDTILEGSDKVQWVDFKTLAAADYTIFRYEETEESYNFTRVTLTMFQWP